MNRLWESVESRSAQGSRKHECASTSQSHNIGSDEISSLEHKSEGETTHRSNYAAGEGSTNLRDRCHDRLHTSRHSAYCQGTTRITPRRWNGANTRIRHSNRVAAAAMCLLLALALGQEAGMCLIENVT
jgi:hypothetical protein